MADFFMIETDDADGFTADQIDDHIWLGDIVSSKDEQLLEKCNITYILTVLEYEPNVQENDGRIRKYVEAIDMPSMELIDYFDDCYDFIESAVSKQSNVLIHCRAGVSRSATIACAYLMKKYRLSYENAMIRLKQKRSSVFPNAGFKRQLLLYENQLCQSATTNPIEKPSGKIEYKCKFCRQILFNDFDLIGHIPGKGRFDAHSKSSSYKAKQNAESKGKNLCQQEWFTDQPIWLTDIFNKDINDGDILCPNLKCRAKLGRYSLIGEKCSCAKWVNPAFHFHRTKIDECPVNSNVDLLLLRKDFSQKSDE